MMVVQLLRGRDVVRSPACPTVNKDVLEVSWDSKNPVFSTFYLFLSQYTGPPYVFRVSV